ncbi:MAG TPA: family 1 encapsulin nanocompartment shell protein [Jatrophihabitans sp.]|jgi:uncharacterized linocin/CFP29 family protein
MNNLHRDLAPLSAAAWADLEDEARRTFTAHVAGRRVVDVVGPVGAEFAAVGTGHLQELEAPQSGVRARLREVLPVVELRVPFTVARAAIDDVERGAKDSDWQPAKDAAKSLAFTEDRLVFDGLASAGIAGLRVQAPSTVGLPSDASGFPTAVATALSALRLAGVSGDYALLLSADAYTAVNETTEHGYPIRQHIQRVLGDAGSIVWAPAISGAVLLTTRGGDYELHIGQDVSIGYLSHDADSVQLYLEESISFRANTSEAAVNLS